MTAHKAATMAPTATIQGIAMRLSSRITAPIRSRCTGETRARNSTRVTWMLSIAARAVSAVSDRGCGCRGDGWKWHGYSG
ncbi:hypothetical protein ABIE28_000728 [Devosia sp. 2618]